MLQFDTRRLTTDSNRASRASGLVRSGALLAVAFLSLLTPAAAAQDVVTVGTVNATSATVDVPVYIRDVSGTPLGRDQATGSRIQSYSIEVAYSPASAVSSVTFSRAGITSSLTPVFETTPTSAGTITLLDTFDESTNLIPFTLNRTAPGDQVAHLVFNLSLSATPGSTITLTLDSSTLLSNQGGTTKETSSNGGLSLVNGAIHVPNLTLTLTPTSRSVTAGSSTSFTATMNLAVSGSTTVTVSSSNTTVATVPSSVTISSGSRNANIPVSTLTPGTSTITASLPAGVGGASDTSVLTVNAPPPTCNTPAAPQLSGPSTVTAGSSFQITWAAVTDATQYVVDEASNSGFTGATSQTLTSSPATFTAGNAGDIRYYRVRAYNRSTGCDVGSAFSNVVTVTPEAVPVPEKRVFPVVGSIKGNFGSYFKTTLQLHNPTSTGITGRIVYHPIGVPGSASDPTLAYALGPFESITYDDLLPAMGVASGLGSADVIADASSTFPVTSMRVFNDAGAAGTSGLSQDPVRLTDALMTGHTGVLLAPPDVSKARMNIGIRTLDQGATITIVVRDADGNVIGTTTKSYPAEYFIQDSSTNILGLDLAGGEAIAFTIESGSAIVYGSTVDNITNDPSEQLAVPVGP